MSDNTKIEWTDATANYVNGCSVVSPGCTNCYAMRLAGTRLRDHPTRAGLTQPSKAGPVWTGEVRRNERVLQDVLGWKKPRRIFWNAHGDLFHPEVPYEWIDAAFAVMALTPHHTHQVLTKRPERMRAYVANTQTRVRIYDLACDLTVNGEADVVIIAPGLNAADAPDGLQVHLGVWPLTNVWLGISVEDQARADERIPHLLATPAAVRFISAEPLLGPVDIGRWIPTCYECGATCGLRLPSIPDIERCTECGEECGPDTEPVFSEGCPKCCGELEPVCPECGHYMVYQHPDTPMIDWVIVGGESGPGARPMHPDWARSLRDQCAAAGVPFHFKQWGAWLPAGQVATQTGLWNPSCGSAMLTTKKNAGRHLDGQLHDGFPQ